MAEHGSTWPLTERSFGSLHARQAKGHSDHTPLPRIGEERAKLQRRAIASVELVRKAARDSGAKDSKGGKAKIWLAVSESPEQRRRTKQLSKTKRAVLEISEKMGKAVTVRAEYRNGMGTYC